MRISARNQIKGAVVEVKKGATTSHVRAQNSGLHFPTRLGFASPASPKGEG
jgi:hypothetical protein